MLPVRLGSLRRISTGCSSTPIWEFSFQRLIAYRTFPVSMGLTELSIYMVFSKKGIVGLRVGAVILSSAEFGRAYLAEGWAARFIRDAIAKYIIVFVGYSADDPPVQYSA